jgi:predicted alpha/beta hydrolase
VIVDRGTDKLAVHVYPEPEKATGPVVLVFPAMGVPARYYRPFAEHLRAAGLGVVVADLRGTGDSTPPPSRRSTYGYADLADDVGAVWQALEPRLGGRTRLLLGHSLGGQAAVLHLARPAPSTVDGLVLVAVGLPYFRTYPSARGALVLPSTQAIAATSALLGVWPGWGFGGRQARGVIRDWGHTARRGRFPARLGADLAAVRTPVLAVSMDHDQYTPHGTTDHLVRMLPAAPVVREHYTAAQAGDRIDHFRWVRAAEALAARIAEFSRQVGAGDVAATRPT